ncbi:MAG: KH domain-containing protein [Candidatus Aenigmatarchaeota archaeon]
MKEVVLVPEERVRVLNKEVIEKIENKIDVKISIKGNSIEIEGEGLDLYQAKNIVKAIARGFSPEKSFRLFNEEEQLKIIKLEFTDKKIKIIKSRLIGTKGQTRKAIEDYSGCAISIYGRTVSIIGKYNQIEIAREAINMILRGSKHSKVYGFLQRARLD